MQHPFLKRLERAPLLCDGAMGTLLYAKGVFINRCYDELNQSQPDLIRGIHRDYVQLLSEIADEVFTTPHLLGVQLRGLFLRMQFGVAADTLTLQLL